MYVTRHHEFESLSPWLATWNELARGVPFRRWEWLEAWWRHYGCRTDGQSLPNYELDLLAVWNDDKHLIGVAPWYRRRTKSGARTIRFLGDGEVCSDYLSILCRSQDETQIVAAVAEQLIAGNTRSSEERWDRFELIGIDAGDTVVSGLLAHLQAAGQLVHDCPALNTWRLELPASWDELLTMLSKQHRCRLRNADRTYFQSGRVNVHRVTTPEQWARFFEVLVDLHARRWQLKGLPGAFASPRFTAFHREISARWVAEGLATLSWLELDGTPLAAEYRIHGDGVMYAYQSGMDTDRLKLRPGELSNMAAIRNAIEHGQGAYDFLRGDEEYKSRWRATPRPMLSMRVIAPHATARARHSAWLAGQNVKQWIKRSATLVGLRKAPRANRQPVQAAGEAE